MDTLLQFFRFDNLPPDSASIVRRFAALAVDLVTVLPRNPERTLALRGLLSSMDQALRAGQAGEFTAADEAALREALTAPASSPAEASSPADPLQNRILAFERERTALGAKLNGQPLLDAIATLARGLFTAQEWAGLRRS